MLDVSQWRRYNEQMARARESVKRRLYHAGISMVTVTPADDFGKVINDFMKRPSAPY